MLGQGLLLAGVGLAIGMAGAILLTRTLAGLIYGVGALDPLTFTAVGAALRGRAGCLPVARTPRRIAGSHHDASAELKGPGRPDLAGQLNIVA